MKRRVLSRPTNRPKDSLALQAHLKSVVGENYTSSASSTRPDSPRCARQAQVVYCLPAAWITIKQFVGDGLSRLTLRLPLQADQDVIGRWAAMRTFTANLVARLSNPANRNSWRVGRIQPWRRLRAQATHGDVHQRRGARHQGQGQDQAVEKALKAAKFESFPAVQVQPNQSRSKSDVARRHDGRRLVNKRHDRS